MTEMRRTLYVAAVCSVVAAISFGGCLIAQSLYSQWRVSRSVASLGSSDEKIRAAALEDLRSREVDVLPHLLKLLKHRNAEVRKFAAWELDQILPTPSAVIDAFAEIVVDPRESGIVKWPMIYKLGKVGQIGHGSLAPEELKAVRALCGTLRDRELAGEAARALGQFGKRAPMAVAPLCDTLNSNQETARVFAAGALTQVNPEKADLIVPILIHGVQSRESGLRDWALHYLEILGPRAAAAAEVLTELAQSEPESAEAIEHTLKRIGHEQ